MWEKICILLISAVLSWHQYSYLRLFSWFLSALPSAFCYFSTSCISFFCARVEWSNRKSRGTRIRFHILTRLRPPRRTLFICPISCPENRPETRLSTMLLGAYIAADANERSARLKSSAISFYGRTLCRNFRDINRQCDAALTYERLNYVKISRDMIPLLSSPQYFFPIVFCIPIFAVFLVFTIFFIYLKGFLAFSSFTGLVFLVLRTFAIFIFFYVFFLGLWKIYTEEVYDTWSIIIL